MAVSRTAATTSAAMERRTGSSQSIAYLLLKPILLLAFALLHITYHLILITRQTGISIQNAIRRPPTRPPASFTSLEDLLSAHDQPRDTIRIPDHLAVVLADTAPSSIRLYLSTLFTRMRQPEARSGQTDTWNEFRMRYEAAVEAKRVSDAAAVIHLARVCGVKKVSVYTSGAMPMVAVEALCGTLRVGYKTKAVVQGAEVALDAEGIEVGSWSRYTGLRKRSNASKSSDSSTGSPASSDSEAGPSSLDETLASSFTADHDAQDSTDATVDIRIGLHPSPQDSPESEPNLQVTLLHSQDGQQRFSEIVSSHIRALASTYLSTTLLPDMASSSTQKRFSASSCRKSWIAKRNLFTSQLTVSQLDDALMQEGYLDEPDLLVVWGAQRGGRTKKLYGFPAWPLRVTDLLFDRSGGKGGYGGGQFVAALRQLGKMEQRFGR